VFYTRIKERSRLSALQDSVFPLIELMEKEDDETYLEREESRVKDASKKLAW
jgi:hypothetical protein